MMTDKHQVVIKLGGSLMDCAPQLVQTVDEHARKSSLTVLIVPGGAIFADNIRRFGRMHSLSNDTAHWMAVLAMEQYAYYLSDLTGIEPTARLEVQGSGVHILLPYRVLCNDDDGLQHSWDTTSDTISAWVARKNGSALIKATDVDGIYAGGQLLSSIYAGDLMDMEETCVDRALPGFLVQHKMDCLVVNGKCTDRVLRALDGDVTAGTLITGKSKF